MFIERLVVLRGAGEMATALAHRLFNCGFKLLLTDVAHPLSVRKLVSFSEAITFGQQTVEGVTAVHISYDFSLQTFEKSRNGLFKEQIQKTWQDNQIPLIIDPGLTLTRELFNDDIEVVIDATINKKNKAQTNPGLAPLVVGLGPGFNAPNDVDVIIETNRGHDLGRLIFDV
ncbi:MAG: putative molybdenum hydroxylase [Streblomastix strix]|uniref:Putative molybdenum hydroxylase n=1 Tax=Streblomastix strix TaxID=222440 RepID=A0A5J4V1P6_9EUKA|nr:MAG: putative molybdenum hydroxylase [Streblomastix strix]